MAVTATSLGAPSVDTASPFTKNTSGTVPSGALVICCLGWIKTGSSPLVPTITGGSLTWALDLLWQRPIQAGSFSVGLTIASAPAPSGLASGTTISTTVTGGTADFGVFTGLLYLEGVDTGPDRLDITVGNIRDTPGNANWTATALTTRKDGDGLVGIALSNDAATSSTASGGFAEVWDAHDAGTDWDFTAVFREGATAGAFTAQGTWNNTTLVDGAACAAYRTPYDTASVAWMKA